MSSSSRYRVPLVLAAISATIYLSILPAHILGGDNAEFAALSRFAGVGHPPGYPLYHLYLLATAWLPGTPAYASALATAVLAILQIFVMGLACQCWNLSRVSTFICVGIFALSSLALVHYTQAEVFALNGLLVACFLCFVAPHPIATSWVQIGFLGLLTGLALSHHHTAVLLLPLLLVGIYQSGKKKQRGSSLLFTVLILIITIAVGLLPYAYYFTQSYDSSSSQLVWANINSLSTLLRHFTRQEYGSFDLSAHSTGVSHVEQLKLLLHSLSSTWGFLLPFSVLGFAVAILSRQSSSNIRLLWLALLLSILLSGPILVLRFNLDVNFLLVAVIERFHILPNQLLILPVAKGIDTFLALFEGIASKNKKLNALMDFQSPFFLVIPGALVMFFFALSLPRLESRKVPTIENMLRNTLFNLPSNSLLIGTGDHQRFGYPYLQEIQGIRQDVAFLTISGLSKQQYCTAIHRKLRTAPMSTMQDSCSLLRIIDLAHQQQRRVFLHLPLGPVSEWSAMLSMYPSQVYGTSIEILPKDAKPLDLPTQYSLNHSLFAKYKLDYEKPWAGHDWSTLSQQAYSSSWLILSQRLGLAGFKQLANQSIEQANKYQPTY